jgi:ankyrin repeat protein
VAFTKAAAGTMILLMASVVPAMAAGSGTELIEAIKHDRRETVRKLLRATDVNAAEADGMTALHWAVRRADVETARALIRKGARVNAANRFGVTPLLLAATNADVVLVDELLAAGANPNVALPDGETILMAAARAGSPEAVQVLLQRGADPNARERTQGQTALMWAAAHNNAAAVHALAEAGADVNTLSSPLDYPLFKWTLNGMVSTALPRGRWTALMFAARENAIESVRALIDAGADLNLQDGEGSTALVLSIVNTHFDLAAVLLERGADPNVADETGMAALYAAVDMRTLAPMLARPPLKLTATLDPIDLVKMLLEHGADPNAQLKKPIIGRQHGAGDTDLGQGATPLMRAAKSHDLTLMRALLDGGADATVTQREFTNAMMLAAGGGGRGVAYSVRPFQVTPKSEAEAVQLLLERGADVNAFNANGMTALHYAAQRGANPIVTLLAERGAILDLKNKQGRTPLDLSLGGSGTGRRGRGTAPVFEATASLLRQLMETTRQVIEPR